MDTSQVPIEHFDFSVMANSQEQRVKLLRHMTNIFMKNADKFNHQQIDVFGNGVLCLVKQVESDVLAELGTKLAPVGNAPKEVILTLACNPDFAVAEPVLRHSERLSDADLIKIGRTNSQGHLEAISKRKHIAQAVTDILVERENAAVIGALARNQGAAFSKSGFTSLAKHAEMDEELAGILGERHDIPPDLLKKLVSKATGTVRARLLALIPSGDQAIVQKVLTPASARVLQEAAMRHDFISAEAVIKQMQAEGRFSDAAVAEFAAAGKYKEMVVGIARLSQAPVELIDQLVQSASGDNLLVACRAAGMNWSTFNAILRNWFPDHRYTDSEREILHNRFLKLSVATAKRVFHFRHVRDEVVAGGVN